MLFSDLDATFYMVNHIIHCWHFFSTFTELYDVFVVRVVKVLGKVDIISEEPKWFILVTNERK